jgi:lipopolysaccharide export system protein LptA
MDRLFFPETSRSRFVLTAAILSALLAFKSHAALGQGLNFGSEESALPIEIFADNGIEWQQDNMMLLAQGNARAERGAVKILADTLRAHYRNKSDGSTDIWRLDALGKVKISSPGETAYGEKGIYDVERGILVLSGGKQVRLITEQDKITAEKQLEFWEHKQMAVARGNAIATRENQTLRAEVISAYLHKDKNGVTTIYRIEAFDGVRITTNKDKVSADRAVYNVESSIAILTGSVRIARGANRLNGCSAEVNMKTGVSKLHSCEEVGGTKGKRVRGVLMNPSKKKK